MNVVTFNPVPTNVTFAKAFAYQSSTGTPVDLTGSTLSMQVRSSAANPTRAFPVVVTITDAPNGGFSVSIDAAQLATAPAGTYVHDLVRLRPDGVTEQIWTGTMVVTAGVTR